ncbi:MAG: leucine--tRNA ligase, partial [Parcubacteria group bacterium]|nr:leucine--tRNA ligase [Parcubacteria group bacterium]
EEVVNGKCERCGGEVVKKEKEQWMLKITEYADRLLEDLENVDFPERVKTLQRDWVGKSTGAEIIFKIKNSENIENKNGSKKSDRSFLNQKEKSVKVFTTRVDTIFGATYLVLAPEHPIVNELSFTNKDEVDKYIKQALGKSDIERQENKEKTGVKLEGITATNPANNKQVPIFIADYVLTGYGTGAIMAVPAHDQRDLEFAKKYNQPIVRVIMGVQKKPCFPDRAFEGEGFIINSGEEFNNLKSQEAKEKIGQKIGADKKINYKLRDWVFSRQRYWGEPIPMIHCEKCGWVIEESLPIELPNIKEYEPTKEGESPLAKVDKWVNVKCPKCKGKAKRETDVMPNWAGSNWYFMRYCDSKNDKEFANEKNLKYWMPVDWYNGGMEHTTLHLLYSRFIFKFLWDIGVVPKELGNEPYKKRTSHGMVLAEGGVKMSKSKGNVINPDDVIKEYGADTLRIYEMFMGPFEQAIAWDTKGVKGVRRFLDKVWRLSDEGVNKKGSLELKKLLHKTIKKVTEDIENLKFNTAVSAFMEFSNEWQATEKGLAEDDFKDLLKLLSVFAPHMAEELWKEIGGKQSITLEKWPEYDIKLIKEEKINLIIQVNGKVRGKIEAQAGISEQEAKELAVTDKGIKQWLDNKEVKKVFFVKDKLINFVI